ncbi:hypothetical protein ES703_115955 [subsurface metagenome]
MKCPLRPFEKGDRYSKDGAYGTACIKEDCAWWDKDQEQCAVMLISTGLWVISQELRELKEKVPHEGQFRR